MKVKVEQGSVTIERVTLLVEDEHVIVLHIATEQKRPRVESYDGVTCLDDKENEQGLSLCIDECTPSRISIQGRYVYSMASPDKYGAHWLLVKEWPDKVYDGEGKTLWTNAA